MPEESNNIMRTIGFQNENNEVEDKLPPLFTNNLSPKKSIQSIHEDKSPRASPLTTNNGEVGPAKKNYTTKKKIGFQ